MPKVTDPNLLKQLNGGLLKEADSIGRTVGDKRKVTDAHRLALLNDQVDDPERDPASNNELMREIANLEKKLGQSKQPGEELPVGVSTSGTPTSSQPKGPHKVTDPELLAQLSKSNARLAAEEAMSFITSSAEQGLDVAGGVVEQPAAGLAALGEQAIYGSTALFTGLLRHWREGTPYVQAFEQEYNELRGKTNPFNFILDSLQPQSDTGKAIFENLGHWMEQGLSAFSDKIYEHGVLGAVPTPLGMAARVIGDPTAKSPAAAALAKGAGAVATVVGPVKAERARRTAPKQTPEQISKIHEEMDADLARNPAQFMQKWYPTTWSAMEAASVGKVKTDSLGIEAAVTQSVKQQLQGLGVGPDLIAGKSLSELVRMSIDAADKVREINPNARQAIVESFVSRIDELKKVEEATRPKALPAPSATPGVIEVTPSGRAATPEQRAAGFQQFQQLSGEQRAEVLGIGPMGQLRTAAESYQRALREADGKTTGPVEQQLGILRRKWRDSFPSRNLAHSKVREQVLQEWLKEGAPYVAWEELRARIDVGLQPKPRIKGKPGVMSRPGGKQAGVVDIEGLEELPKRAAEAAKAARTAGLTPRGGDDQGYARVEAAYEKSLAAAQASEQRSLKQTVSALKDKVADHQGTLKSVLEKQGKLGSEVVDRLNLISGATMRAKFMFDKSARPIFKGMSSDDLRTLSKLVRARTALEISRRNPKFKHTDGVTPADLEGYIRTLAAKDPARYQSLSGAADRVFVEYRKQLDELKHHGLLSEESYDRLVQFDYSPTEYVKLIDPSEDLFLNGQKITVTHSGVPYMKGGSTGAVVLDAKKLLAEHIARTQNRIMRNESVKALHKLAEANPDLGFLKVIPVKEWNKKGEALNVHIPPGHLKLTHMQEGKQQVLAIEESLGAQWMFRPPAMDSIVADIARFASGTSIVKALATSYNPLFPVAGLPMDIFHTYFAGQGYSRHFPVFLGEMAVDLATVSKDAIVRGKRYQDALMEGMGFDFMTHQGREIFSHKGSLADQLTPKWERTKKVLSWLNETSEIMVRLAHRERLIKGGMPSWQATARARDRLDYSQGGVIAKAADTVIPYSNVAVQGWRSAIREGAKSPKAASAKLTWATAGISGVVGAQIFNDPEAWQDIPVYDKINGLPITIPGMEFTDALGNRRVGYVVLRTDNILAPLHALVVGTMEKQILGKTPKDLLKKTLSTLPSLLGNVTVPMIDAWYQYTTNTDTQADAPIYTGLQVPPELEYKGPAFQQPTPEIYKLLGQATGLSPQRLERASRSLIPTNPITGGLSQLVNWALDGQDPSVRHKTTMDMLAENKNLRRVIKFTHPAHREMNEIDEAVEAYGGKVKPLYDTIDAYAVKFNQGEVTADQVRSWVTTQPPELQEKLSQRFKTGASVEKVLRDQEVGQGVPSRVWWMKLSDSPAEVRAQVFFDRWISLPSEERKRLERVAGSMQKAGVGFMSEDFRNHFGRLRQQFGDDER